MNATRITLIALGIATLSCTISMMYVFMSGDAGGSDVRSLMALQSIAAPVAVAILVAELLRQSRASGLRAALTGVWNATPAWAVIAIMLVNLLVGIGELALLLRARLGGEPAHWFEHAPLVCALACSIAWCTVYARAYPGDSTGVTRW